MIRMPRKRRIDKSRDTRITGRSIDLFERLMRLRRQQRWSPEIRDLSCELDAEIGIKPWNSNPALDCDDDEPPTWMNDPEKVEDWWRSREIREELEAALSGAP